MIKKFIFILSVFISAFNLSAFSFTRNVDGKDVKFYVENDSKLKKIFEFFNLLYFEDKLNIIEVGWTDYDGFIASTFYYPSTKEIMFAISKPRTDKLRIFKDLTKQSEYNWLICHELIHAYLVTFEEPDLTHTSEGWHRMANWFRKKKNIKIIDN